MPESTNQFNAAVATTHESALETLAKNLETVGKYKEMQTDVKVNDMIAFKVMTADFQISDYVIGLVEELHGDTNNPSYDLSLLIMGTYGIRIFRQMRQCDSINEDFSFTAGRDHIKHLAISDDDDVAEMLRIQIDRQDIYECKILEM